MQTHVRLLYLAPEAPTQPAIPLTEFPVEQGSSVMIPAEGQIVTLPVGQTEDQVDERDYRVVEVRHAFSGFSPHYSHHIVHVLVTDADA